MIEPRLLKGFRDYDPQDQVVRQNMFAKIQTVFERFGFLPLYTPALEYKEILTGKIGEDEKLIYSFKDNGDRDVALRYDLTVSLARYVAQNQNQLTFPFKRYQIGPVWRAENTQRGRFREFIQCDIDAVGSDSPLADAEVIAGLASALEVIGISDYQVLINNRSVFSDLSVTTVRLIDKLDKIGLAEFKQQLQDQNISAEEAKKALALVDQGDVIVPDVVAKVINLVTELGVDAGKIKFKPTIARGLDYYTGTVFEIVLPDKPEFGSIAGGGRYDSLVDQFSSQPVPAVGGSIGVDRLFEAMTELNLIERSGVVQALVINLDEKLTADYLQLVAQLRQTGINSEVYFEPVKLDKQFKYAEGKNIQYALIMGEDEKSKGVVQLKNLQTRDQQEVGIGELAGKILRKV